MNKFKIYYNNHGSKRRRVFQLKAENKDEALKIFHDIYARMGLWCEVLNVWEFNPVVKIWEWR